MAIPIPSTPTAGILAAAAPYDQDRGADMVNDRTKSSYTKPILYIEQDACDQDSQVKFRIASTLNELTPDCELIANGNLSISGKLPFDANQADIQAYLDFVTPLLVAAFPV